MAKDNLTKKILDKQLSRKQFLQSMGAGLVAAVGINSAVSILASPNKAFDMKQKSKGRKFNSGKYGVR